MASAFRKTLKSARARTRRIDIAFKYAGYLLILSYFLFVISAWLSYRDALRINTIEILGAHAVEKDDIIRISADALSKKFLLKIDRNNAFLYPKAQIVKKIYELDGRVSSVEMKVVERKHLVVSVEEYMPQLIACPNAATTSPNGKECYLGDGDGYVFARSPEYSGHFFPIFITHDASLGDGGIIGTRVLPQDEFLAINEFLEALRNVGFTPKRIEHIGAHDYEIMTEKPWGIRWSSTASSTQSVDNLNLLLGSMKKDDSSTGELKMIDLRFGNKIFYQ